MIDLENILDYAYPRTAGMVNDDWTIAFVDQFYTLPGPDGGRYVIATCINKYTGAIQEFHFPVEWSGLTVIRVRE